MEKLEIFKLESFQLESFHRSWKDNLFLDVSNMEIPNWRMFPNFDENFPTLMNTFQLKTLIFPASWSFQLPFPTTLSKVCSLLRVFKPSTLVLSDDLISRTIIPRARWSKIFVSQYKVLERLVKQFKYSRVIN